MVTTDDAIEVCAELWGLEVSASTLQRVFREYAVSSRSVSKKKREERMSLDEKADGIIKYNLLHRYELRRALQEGKIVCIDSTYNSEAGHERTWAAKGG